ncbi:MAG: arsenate reductase (glutaredoxin) [Candidatus Hydrogenedentes bacterium]|nr:arsenate reductase (glutaredoxin) [Candidatus Hydrogenedentota bacterium]
MKKDEVLIYHNPRCSKSRETLDLLRQRGVEPRVVEYLKEPPTSGEIRKLIRMLGGDAHALLRTKEAPYKELGLSPSSSTDAIVDAVASHPVLLERPIVVRGDKAEIGRPPENVLRLL